MKTLALLLLLAANAMGADFSKLIPALIQVESGGNDRAVGDNGRSLGCLQIGPSVIADVNAHYKKEFRHADAFDRGKAVNICALYLNIYCKEADFEKASRRWNGGPTGDRKKATLGYWKKVKANLK